MSAAAVDPITLEVLREAFASIVREMRVTLVRTAYSSILYEGEDFSCVLMDGDAQIVAMSKGQDHPLHIVPISWSMKAVREKFGDDIHPGDIFLHNDPYTGGTHLNDVAMIYPALRGRAALRLPGRARALGRRGRDEPGQPLRRRHRDLPGRRPHPAHPDRGPRQAQPGRARSDLPQHARARASARATSTR